VGVTGNLRRRVWQHKQGSGSEFCSRYKIDRLVYYESFDDVAKAINREKQIKGLLRIKKIGLIVGMNPAWRDLSSEWYTLHVFQPTKCIDPSLANPPREDGEIGPARSG
jgi:putative endonuclease